MRKLLIVLTIIFLPLLNYPGEFVFAAPTEKEQETHDPFILGQRIYRQGILPSGEPMQAYVQGDIPIDGRMATCESCHQRSGLGSTESFVIVPATNGRILYKSKSQIDPWSRFGGNESATRKIEALSPIMRGKDLRPAYTNETLADVLRTGEDPAGNLLFETMPSYDLNDNDMKLLIDYLKSLSVVISPGVTKDTIHFATVITDGVDERDKHAMLSALLVHIKDKNIQTRNQAQRAKHGSFTRADMDAGYRRQKLSIWELKGPRETWTQQLNEYYKAEPVFAILGGIVSGEWRPVHNFCEKNKIPCIFPITDFPVISDSDWYTLYFSKGTYQEGEAAARYLRRLNEKNPLGKIVQIYRDKTRGAFAAKGFQESWDKFGLQHPENIILEPEKRLTGKSWDELIKKKDKTIILYWLGKEDFQILTEINDSSLKPEMLFASASILKEEWSMIPDSVKDFVYITYPYGIPDKQKKNYEILKTWLISRNIPITNIKVQSNMFFLGSILTGTLMHLKDNYYRDHFLEIFDMMIDETLTIATYPRLSFGPGQRYASKGCYIVQLQKGPANTMIQKSGWIIH